MQEYSIYEDLLNIENLKIDSIEKFDKKLEIHCHIDTEQEKCPKCNKVCTFVKQKTTTKIRDLSISEREVWLILTKRQFVCDDCSSNFTERLDWVKPNKSYTKRFSIYVFEFVKNQAFQALGGVLNMCPKTIERIFYERAKSLINIKENWLKVRHLGIDEISNRKGRGNYCCVLTNLETGEEIDILPDRKLDTIVNYFKKLGLENCPQIEVISSDMWDAYATVAAKVFPNARHVIDRFHVVKSLNEALDKVRKEARREMPDSEELKKLKWVLFKRPENCTEEELVQLDAAFEQFPPLFEFYMLRNAFNTYFDVAPNKLWLDNQLNHWVELVEKQDLKPFKKFLKTLSNWKTQIINFAETHVTNAATEGLNNVIRQVKRMSYGMYNFHNLRLRVLARYI